MGEKNSLAAIFEAQRPQLRAMAYRMLGSLAGADDAVQDAWLRVSASGLLRIENPGGWLTTVVARGCLDMLRAKKSRREEPLQNAEAKPPRTRSDPEQETLLAEAQLHANEIAAPAVKAAQAGRRARQRPRESDFHIGHGRRRDYGHGARQAHYQLFIFHFCLP